MKKIAILGCENSHANSFIEFIQTKEEYKDVEILGVYTDETEVGIALGEKYNVYVMKSYDEFVDEADGIIVTARHGDNHYKYAKPYIKKGIHMFIDKPITVSEDDALNLVRDIKENNVTFTGGSSIVYADMIKDLKADISNCDKVLGGYLRFPYIAENNYGNFYFYAQHLVEVEGFLFGKYPKEVSASLKGGLLNTVFHYDNYDINAVFVDGNFEYFAYVSFENEIKGGKFNLDGCFEAEFDAFYRILNGEKSHMSYEDFIAPVFVMNAIERSIKSGKKEKVNTFSI